MDRTGAEMGGKERRMKDKEYIVPLNEWDIADGYWGEPQELIRCRDCKFCSLISNDKLENTTLPREAVVCELSPWFRRLTKLDSYCSCAERKEE